MNDQELQQLSQKMDDMSLLLDIVRDTIAGSALSTLVTDQFGGMVLHIDGSRTNQLVIQISNQTSGIINIQQLSGPASSYNCNVTFTFPNDTFYFYTPPTVNTSTPGSWQLATDSAGGWIGNVYLANTGTCALQPKGQAGDTLELIVDYGGAVPGDSTLINVPAQVQYQNMQTASGVPINGSTPAQTLTLMADEGQPLPLMGAFVGVATVLNDGTTQQNLTLRLVNTSEDPIEFIVPPSGSPTQSYIEVALPVSDAAGDAIWALSGTAAWKLINPSLTGSASTGWRVAASTATAGVFILTPDFTIVQNIPPGGTINLVLAGVTSALEPGMVQAQVSLKRFAVYGTQSFGVALEKSPLVYNSDLGSGMTLSAGTLGANQALTVNGDSSSELIHLNQTGSGHALLVDGGAVTVNNALNANSAAISGALSSATATVSGLVSAGNATVSGIVSAATANISGALTADTATINTSVRITGTSWQTRSASLSLGGHGNFNIDAPGNAGGRFMVQDTTGYVGINNPVPQAMLHVNGSTILNGPLIANSGPVSMFGQGVMLAQGVNIAQVTQRALTDCFLVAQINPPQDNSAMSYNYACLYTAGTWFTIQGGTVGSFGSGWVNAMNNNQNTICLPIQAGSVYSYYTASPPNNQENAPAQIWLFPIGTSTIGAAYQTLSDDEAAALKLPALPKIPSLSQITDQRNASHTAFIDMLEQALDKQIEGGMKKKLVDILMSM